MAAEWLSTQQQAKQRNRADLSARGPERSTPRVTVTESRVEFTGANGVGQSLSLDNELKLHLLDRPTTQIDMTLNIKLDGSFDGSAFDGSGEIGIGLRARF